MGFLFHESLIAGIFLGGRGNQGISGGVHKAKSPSIGISFSDECQKGCVQVSDKIIFDPNAYPGRGAVVASITLNRPEKENAVDESMIDEFTEILSNVKDSHAVILLIKGSGGNFCAGRDASPGSSHSPFKIMLSKIIRLNSLLLEMPQITVAEVNGKALGFGCGLSLLSDISVASSDSIFGFPEMNYNLPPTIVASYLPRWISRKKAFGLIVSGRDISAEEAEKLGLVSEVVPERDFIQRVSWWINNLLGKSPSALKMCKSFSRTTRNMSFEDATNYGLVALSEWSTSK